jgi:hypothetical protein
MCSVWPREAANAALGLGLLRVVEDAQVEIEAGRLVAVLDQHVPQGEGVLAARHPHHDLLVAGEHLVAVHRLRDLLAEELEEVRRAEGRVVTSQLEGGGAPALAALHRVPALPPDMTGRTSSTSSPPTTVSPVSSSLPRMTSTVLGRMSSSTRAAP